MVQGGEKMLRTHEFLSKDISWKFRNSESTCNCLFVRFYTCSV